MNVKPRGMNIISCSNNTSDKLLTEYWYEVINEVRPFYERNDTAHNMKHACDVCDLALDMHEYMIKNNNAEAKKISRYEIIAAAWVHDIYSTLSRDNHHEVAATYVLDYQNKPIFEIFDKEQIHRISHAVREHRASYTGEYYSILSEIISAADRGIPNIELIINRSIVYRNGKAVDNAATARAVYEHIKQKYSRNGYGRFNNIYKEYFQYELDNLYDTVDMLTFDNVQAVVSMYF